MTMQGTTPAAGGGASSSTSGGPPAPRTTQRIPRADTTTPPTDRLGPYRLVQVIGEGGMGVVHLGVDRRGRAVAVKVLRDHAAADPDFRARLDREVQTLSRIRHPRVAPVLDADTTGPRPYVVTRYIPGEGLDHRVRDGGPFVGDDLVRLGRGLAEALDAIHAAGIVHRDLKPGNVLMVDGDPVVIDFGIAHVVEDIRLTSTGLVMGTPGYLSPEAVREGAVTPGTDWWGWAATLLFAATGRPPFGSDGLDVVLTRVREGRPDVEGLPPGLRDLFTRALAPDPTRRPLRRELLAMLEGHQEPETVRIAEPTQWLRADDTRENPVLRPTVVDPSPAPPRASARPGQGAAYQHAAPTPPMPTANPGPRRPESHPDTTAGTAPRPRRERERVARPRVPYHERPLGDPRLGRPGRTGALMLFALVVAVLAGTWPVVGLVVALTWSIVARTADRVVTSTVLRRHSYGAARRSDAAMAAAASPLHLVAGVLATALVGLPCALVGISGAFLASVVATVIFGSASLWGGPELFVGALLAQWTAWWGPGGTSLRRGSRSVMRALTPEGPGENVVMLGMGVIVAALALWSVISHGVPSFAPYDASPSGLVKWQW